MRRTVAFVAAVTFAASLMLGGGAVAFAQASTGTAQPPGRIGNVWGGNDHEIAPGAVIGSEKSAGVALPPAQRQRQNAEVEREAAKLLHQTPPTSDTSR